MRIVIEEIAGQHTDLMYAANPPYCRCENGGAALVGNDSCLYCGRYLPELYDPVDREADLSALARFVRERPHSQPSEAA